MIRPATIHDVPRMQAVINSHAEFGRMLFKSLAQLYEDLRDYAVYEVPGPAGTPAARPAPPTGRRRRSRRSSSRPPFVFADRMAAP